MISEPAKTYKEAIYELATHMWLVDTVKESESGVKIDTGEMALKVVSYIYSQPLDAVRKDVNAILQVSRYSR